MCSRRSWSGWFCCCPIGPIGRIRWKEVKYAKFRSIRFYYFLRSFYNSRVAILLCGGNIDSNILGRCIERSLAADGRLLKFSLIISDRPGGVSEVCKLLANLGTSIKQMDHERAWLTAQVFHVVVSTQ